MRTFTASAFMLLICTAALLSTTEGRPTLKTVRCGCFQMYSKTPIPAKSILSLRVIPAGPHCRHEEIIATMKKGMMCLDPTKDWVISLKEEFYKRKTAINPNTLLSTTEGKLKHLNRCCECPQMHSEPPIPAETILLLRVIPAEPHCKNAEIIATVKNEQRCLDPTKDWVISLKEEIYKKALQSTTEGKQTKPVTTGKPKYLNLHCACPQMHSEPPIPAETILSLRVIPAGPHCKNEEIM